LERPGSEHRRVEQSPGAENAVPGRSAPGAWAAGCGRAPPCDRAEQRAQLAGAAMDVADSENALALDLEGRGPPCPDLDRGKDIRHDWRFSDPAHSSAIRHRGSMVTGRVSSSRSRGERFLGGGMRRRRWRQGWARLAMLALLSLAGASLAEAG